MNKNISQNQGSWKFFISLSTMIMMYRYILNFEVDIIHIKLIFRSHKLQNEFNSQWLLFHMAEERFCDVAISIECYFKVDLFDCDHFQHS